MSFSSTIQILKVDEPVTRKGKDGSDYTINTAQCALLTDDGRLDKVGRLRIPEALKESVKEGIFRATFSLAVAEWGQNKGDVVTQLVGIVPVPVRGAPAAAPAK